LQGKRSATANDIVCTKNFIQTRPPPPIIDFRSVHVAVDGHDDGIADFNFGLELILDGLVGVASLKENKLRSND
jgi:hypothetical protein